MNDIPLNLRQNTGNPFTYEVTNIDGLLSFLKTIDWSEKWLWCLIVFHLTCFFSILFSHRCSNFQVILFFTLVVLCYSSEKLNELGSKYWQYFSMEQYFDSHGLFISVVFSSPILINCCTLLILWLYQSYVIMKNIVQQKKRLLASSKNSKKDN